MERLRFARCGRAEPFGCPDGSALPQEECKAGNVFSTAHRYAVSLSLNVISSSETGNQSVLSL